MLSKERTAGRSEEHFFKKDTFEEWYCIPAKLTPGKDIEINAKQTKTAILFLKNLLFLSDIASSLILI